MRTIVTYETHHGTAEKLARIIASTLNAPCINVDTPFMAEDETSYDVLITVFGFRGPYTAQLTKLFLSRMQGKLRNKNLIAVGEGIFSDKEFPSVAESLRALAKPLSFHSWFTRGELRMDTLTFEEQHLLGKFAELTGMKLQDMGRFDPDAAQQMAYEIAACMADLTVVEDAVQKRWVCSVCGYIHTGDEPPAECPTCHQPGSVFKPL